MLSQQDIIVTLDESPCLKPETTNITNSRKYLIRVQITFCNYQKVSSLFTLSVLSFINQTQIHQTTLQKTYVLYQSPQKQINQTQFNTNYYQLTNRSGFNIFEHTLLQSFTTMKQQSQDPTIYNQHPPISDVFDQWHYIDAKDNQGDWRVGVIIDKNERAKQFKVRFDGWPAKWDEFYKFDSPKLEHFRLITIGYTGQKTHPAVRPHWKFDLQDHNKKLQQLRKFMGSNRFNLKGYQLNQYLRGKHYIYVDCLLETTFSQYAQLRSCIDYLKSHIDLALEYLSHFDTSFKRERQDIVLSNQAAFANSYYEVMDACTSIFGGYKRINAFYKNNETLLSHLKQVKQKPSITATTQQFADFYIRNIYYNYFAEKEGWQVISKLLGRLLNEKIMIPFEFLDALISMYNQLDKFSLPKKTKKFTQIIFEILKRNFNLISQKNIKDLQKSTISNASDKMISMLTRNAQREKSAAMIAKTESSHELIQNTIKQLEMMDLEVSYQFFKSPYFDKKLKGINCLKDSLNKIYYKHITAKEYYDWAMKVGLLKEICNDNTHVEMIKRASEIIKLLCENKVLTTSALDLIWEARKDTHEATLKALDELLLQIVPYLSGDQIDYLFNKIIKVKVEEWDSDYLELAKRFSEFAIRQDKTSSGDYGLSAIYNYACIKQDDNSLNALFDLLNIALMDKKLNEYRNICIQKIKDGVDSFFHVQLFLRIQKKCFSEVAVDKNMIKTLVKDIIKNSNKVSELPIRFELLDCLLAYRQNQLNFEEQDFDKLWATFKNQEKPEGTIFLNWLCPFDEHMNCYRIKYYLSSEIKQYIFKEILCNHKKNDFFNLDLNQCNIFIAFFIQINIANGKLMKVKQMGARFKVKSLELIGLSQLWGIFMNSKNQKVIRRIAEFICQIYSKPAPQIQKEKEEMGMKLIQKAVDSINSGVKKQNHKLVRNFLHMLLTFIEKVEGVFTYDQNFRPRGNLTKQYTVVNTVTNQKHEVKFNIYMPFGFLRRRIAKLTNMDIKYFQLEHKSKSVIPLDIDQSPINECAIGLIIHVIPCEPKQNYVKRVLNRYFDLFFDLLGTDYSQDVWNIVSILPIVPEMKKRIDDVNDWQKFLQGGIYKQLYLLRIIQSMAVNEWEKFIGNNGMKAVASKLNYSINSEIDVKYLNSLTAILIKCICSEKKSPEMFSEVSLKDIVKKLILMFIKLLDYSSNSNNQDNFRDQYQLGKSIFDIIFRIKSYTKVMCSFSSLPNLNNVLTNGLMNCPNKLLKQIFCTEFLRLIISQQKEEEESVEIISVAAFTQLFELVMKAQNTSIYFRFCLKLVEKLQQGILKNLFKKVPKIINNLVRFIEQNPGQKNFVDENETLWGVTQLIKEILNRKQLNDLNLDRQFLTQFIVNQCLFQLSQNKSKPKCKTQSTRISAFQLLWALISKNGELAQKVIEFLSKFHKNGQWRTRKWSQWTINPKLVQKSSTGFVGLKNLGCICYMNSFLQQAFMIKSFRESILNAEDPLFGKIKEEDNLLYQLKSMFVALEQSDQQFYNPKPFTVAFKDYDGKPTNVLEQMDIDQFSGFLLDKLQSQLKDSKNARNIVNNHFGGVISNQIICKDCPHYSENKEPFVSLSLQVKNKKNIYESLDALIKGQMLEGENAYHCDRCSKKVAAVKRVCIKQLPNHLIIALKRFDFNYETMTKTKINDFCEFPHQLNLQKYSQNYLRKTEKNDNKFGDEQILIDYPPEYYEYELKGVVIHLGFADNGHYYSYIQDREETKNWFQFNDSIVRKFDVEHLGNEAFGGEERTMDINVKQKNRNAYLLFYDRKTKLDSNGQKINDKVTITPRNELPYLNKFILNLKDANQKYYLFRLMFSPDYDEFLKCILNNSEPMDDKTNNELLNFALLFFLTKTIRDKEKKPAFTIGNNLLEKVKTNPEFGTKILKIFSNQGVLLQFLKNNPLKEVRKLLSTFIVEVCRLKYKEEAEGANNRLFECVGESKVSSTVLGNFVNAILKLITSSKVVNYNNQIFMILAKISEFGPETAQFMLKKRVLPIILQSLLDKESKIKPQFETSPEQQMIGQSAIEDQRQMISEYLSMKNKIKKQEEKPYLWYLLSELLKHCDLKVGNYPDYFTGTNFQLSKDLQLVYLNSSFIYNVLTETKNKLMMRKLIKYLCTISIENPKMSEEIPKILSKGLKVCQSPKYRSIMMMFKHFIRIPDSIDRLKSILEIKLGLEENKKYAIESDIITQWVIKIARKNKQLAKYMKEEESTLRLMQTTNKQRHTTQQIASKHRVLCDKIYHNLHGIMVLKSESSYIELSKFKEKEILALLGEGEMPPRDDAGWDSDDDLADKELSVGDTVMAFIDKGILNFVEVKLLDEVLEHLTVEYNGEHLSYWKDEQTLAVEHKVFSFDETRNNLLCESDETASIGSYNDIDV